MKINGHEIYCNRDGISVDERLIKNKFLKRSAGFPIFSLCQMRRLGRTISILRINENQLKITNRKVLLNGKNIDYYFNDKNAKKFKDLSEEEIQSACIEGEIMEMTLKAIDDNYGYSIDK